MLITVSTTRPPATDLGFLLHKHPERIQAFEVSGGTAHVFYPEAGPQRCTAALLLEVDPVGLVRRGDGAALADYVDDRPYAASSLVSVALREVFRTAMAGRCAARPELVDEPLPLEVTVAALPSPSGAELVRRLFGPLGWQVEAASAALDETVPQWGDAPYLSVRLTGRLRLADALNHLYVLVPALGGAKHYRIGPDEVDKLLRAGAGWLAAHPERELVTRRYLVHRRTLTRDALARLAELDGADPDGAGPDGADPESADPGTGEPDPPTPLRLLRRGAVLAVLRAAGVRRVADLGCGEGLLVAELLADPSFTEVLAVDVSARALHVLERRLRPDRMPQPQRDRLTVLQSSLVYTDARLHGWDAAVLCEVVEHVDPPRLAALEHAVFGAARPGLVVVTTPNAEYNTRWGLAGPRHRDHRFEWTRAEFRAWAERVAAAHGYAARFLPVGEEDPVLGPPTQLAVFERGAA